MVKLTKTQITINVMTENKDKSMSEVVKLIAIANSVSESVAKGAYRWCVAKGKAPGVVATTAKVRSERKVKDKKPKVLITRKLQKSVAAKVAEVQKSSFEIDLIKEANLARMKAVTAKVKKVREYGPGRTAVQGEATPDDFDPQLAREEVASMIAEIDRNRSAYVGPKFLED
jgi:hypothetical protein